MAHEKKSSAERFAHRRTERIYSYLTNQPGTASRQRDLTVCFNTAYRKIQELERKDVDAFWNSPLALFMRHPAVATYTHFVNHNLRMMGSPLKIDAPFTAFASWYAAQIQLEKEERLKTLLSLSEEIEGNN